MLLTLVSLQADKRKTLPLSWKATYDTSSRNMYVKLYTTDCVYRTLTIEIYLKPNHKTTNFTL